MTMEIIMEKVIVRKSEDLVFLPTISRNRRIMIDDGAVTRLIFNYL